LFSSYSIFVFFIINQGILLIFYIASGFALLYGAKMTNIKNSTFDPHTLKADIGRAGLTISAVCDASGITNATFSNWLKGRKPQADKLKRFNSAFQRLQEQPK